jgi:hypothetical protein
VPDQRRRPGQRRKVDLRALKVVFDYKEHDGECSKGSSRSRSLRRFRSAARPRSTGRNSPDSD